LYEKRHGGGCNNNARRLKYYFFSIYIIVGSSGCRLIVRVCSFVVCERTTWSGTDRARGVTTIHRTKTGSLVCAGWLLLLTHPLTPLTENQSYGTPVGRPVTTATAHGHIKTWCWRNKRARAHTRHTNHFVSTDRKIKTFNFQY